MRILTIEDDILLAQTVADVLAQQHYAVDIALDGETGRQFAIATPYDLILLDVMLPKLDGITLCRQLRQQGYQIPILLLTAKDSSTDKVIGLDAGADDYVIKPIDFDELTARIRAVLRRGYSTSSPVLMWDALSLDPGTLEVTYDRQPLHLTATEHRLLELFLRNPQQVFSPSAIVDYLWTYDNQPEASTVKTYVKNLRQKLKAVGAPADLIETVYGVGYRLKREPNPSQAVVSSSSEHSSASDTLKSKEQQTLLAVNKARDCFRIQVPTRLAVLRQIVAAMEAGAVSMELYGQAIHEAHRLSGALGTFGFPAASQLAGAIENLLQPQLPESEQLPQLRQLVHELSQELETLLTQPTSGRAIATVRPHLLVVSHDSQWVQSLRQETITIKQLTLPVGDTWIEQTLHSVQSERPDLVLLDLQTAPTEWMMALLTDLSKRLPVPVLVIAEHDNFEHRIEVARRNGYRFLLKTTPSHQVLKQIMQAIQNSQARESRILVVDSDRSTLEEVRDILEPWDLQLKLLTDPHQFWQTLVTFSPNLLILDVEIPSLNGIDLCRVVRTDPDWCWLPILFLTSRCDAETIHQLFKVGADDCISKPIAGAKLLTRTLNRLARMKW